MPKGSFHAAKTHCPAGHEYLIHGFRTAEGCRICRLCRQLQARARYQRTAPISREYKKRKKSSEQPSYLKQWERQINKLGCTVEDYNSLLSVVPGCAICSKTPEENGKRLAVDHDHATGRVRGLLCDTCNRGIGLLDDGRHLPAVRDYLSASPQPPHKEMG